MKRQAARRAPNPEHNGEPRPDAVALLQTQHREIEELFSQLDRAQTADRKAAIFRTIADGLTIHTTIEQHHFYPSVKDKGTLNILLESLEEHLGIRRLLSDLVDVSVTDPAFDPRVKGLQQLVDNHVRDEERDLFPKVRKLFSNEELVDIADRMRDEQKAMEGTEPRLRLRPEAVDVATLS